MWRSAVAVLQIISVILGVIIGSYLLWVKCMSAAWEIGDWVGASHIQIPNHAVLVAFTPAIINFIFGVLCLCLSYKRRSGMLIASGITSLIMAVLLIMVTIWSLSMGSIM